MQYDDEHPVLSALLTNELDDDLKQVINALGPATSPYFRQKTLREALAIQQIRAIHALVGAITALHGDVCPSLGK